MTQTELLVRLCDSAYVELWRVWEGHLTDREFRELAEAAARLSYEFPEEEWGRLWNTITGGYDA